MQVHYTLSMWDLLLDLIFPRQCLGCGKWGKYICPDCSASKIEYFDNQVCPYCEKSSPYGYTHSRCVKSNGLDGLFVLSHYHGLIPKAIHEIKYQGYFAILSELAEFITQKYHRQYNFKYFVPIPLSKNRERARGFNQAEKLANELVKIPFRHSGQSPESPISIKVVNLLERTRDTRPQFELKYEDRQHNMKDAFSLNHELITKNLSGLSFCLVDDVATTGSTLFECAKVLKHAGSEKVYGITIARGG